MKLRRRYTWDTGKNGKSIILRKGKSSISLDLSEIYLLEYDLWSWLDSRNLGMVNAYYDEKGVTYHVHKDSENTDCGTSYTSKFLFPVLALTGLYRFSSRIARKIWGLCPCKHRISFFGMKDDNGKEYKQWQQRRQAKK